MTDLDVRMADEFREAPQAVDRQAESLARLALMPWRLDRRQLKIEF